MKIKLGELIDVNRELQKLMNSGKVLIGSRETLKVLKKGAEGDKVVIYASNCPKEIKDEYDEIDKDEKIRFYEYPANNLELGLACGKPFSIASLCIIDTGESEILRLLAHSGEKTKAKNLGEKR